VKKPKRQFKDLILEASVEAGHEAIKTLREIFSGRATGISAPVRWTDSPLPPSLPAYSHFIRQNFSGALESDKTLNLTAI
jgi:hypothetical protein